MRLTGERDMRCVGCLRDCETCGLMQWPKLQIKYKQVLEQLNRLKECSNCAVAPGKKCKTCIYNSISKTTAEHDYWIEHRGEGE